MRRRLAIPAALFGLGQILSIPAFAQDEPGYLDDFTPLSTEDWAVAEAGDAIMTLAPLWARFGFDAEGDQDVDLQMSEEDGRIFAQITQRGLADDSIIGERHRMIIVRDEVGEGWRLQAVGRQQLCARGEDANEWTTAACP